MTHKKTKGQRLLALLLAMLMLMSGLSTAAFAADIGGADAADVLLSDAEQEAATEVAPDAPSPDDLTEDDAFADADAPDDESQEDEQTSENDQGDDQAIETPQESETVPDTGNDAPADTPPSYDDDEPVQDGAPDELTDEDFSGSPLQIMIEAYGYVYAETLETAMIYSSADRLDDEHVFTITNTAVLLATEYAQRSDGNSVKVWFIAQSGETLTGYVAESALSGLLFSDEDMELLTENLWAFLIPTGAGELMAFVVEGEKPFADEAVAPDFTPETPPDSEVASPDDEAVPLAQVGDFVAVTTATRAFLGVDSYAMDTGYGDLGVGSFVRDGIVQVESIETDYYGRAWYRIRYMFMYDDGHGLECSESRYVLAAETYPTDAQGLTDTYYLMSEANRAALSVMPLTFYPTSTSFNLVNAYGQIKSVSLYDFDVWADSDSRDVNKHPAIAKCDNISGGYAYAYPHTFNYSSAWCYCIEHNYDAPSSRNDLTGPYVTVDWEGYVLRKSAGQSHIYSGKTMHAIAWSVYHSWPFKKVTVSGESADDINFWSFCAGQIAIREIIGQMEGRQYIRDGWDLSDFYRFKDCAPSDYLNYARWLVSNAVSYAQQFDDNDCSATVNSITKSGSNYIANITVRSTNGQKIAIKKEDFITSVSGTIGSEQAWYYVSDGATVNVTITKMPATLELGLVGDSDDECGWVIAVPNGVSLQRLFVPQEGNPLAITATKIPLEMPAGEIQVTKKNTNGALLSGATFELLNGGGSVLKTQTTGTNGVTTFTDLDPGTYTVREKGAPTGYLVSVPNTQSTAVTAGSTAKVTFTNEEIKPKIKIVKKDSLTKEPLAGAQFRITRLSGPAGYTGGTQVVATITTGADGTAETGWLGYGKYRIEETVVPQHFVNKNFSTEIEAYENGKTYTVEVENEPSKGYLQLVKTDRLDRTLIEGVQFDIYYNDQYGSGLAATMTTDSKGVATSPPLRKGKYLVKEHADPEGYVMELVTLDAVVRPDETTHLSATNQPVQGKIRIIKKDQLTKELLAGAEFTITRISGLPSHKGSNNGEKVAVIVTDKDGVAESPLLTWGTYRVTETKVPEHFVDNKFSTQVTIDSENLKTYEIEVENEPSKGWIRLTKRDRQNGNPIEGVQFDVYYNDQYGEGLACTMVTGKDGIAMSEPLRKGRYLVREHGATPGYLFEEIELETTVRSDEITELEATNRHVTVRLKLMKRDADEYGGDSTNTSTRGDGVLTGAVFQVLAGEDIRDRQGNMVYAKGDVVVESITTTDDQAAALTDELWPGLYEITELSPPTGYLPSNEHIFVDARDAANQSVEAIITYDGVKTNEIKMGAKAIVKILGDDSGELGEGRLETPEVGAEFKVYLRKAGSYENAREIERDYLVTDEHGYAMTKPLPYGIYVLEQVAGKEGYEIKAPIDFMIDGSESLVNPPVMTLNDRPILYRLRLVKKDAETGKTVALAGTSFKLKNADGEYVTQTVFYPKETQIDTFTTDESGTVTLPETVKWGLYFCEEVRSPKGYLLPAGELAIFVGRDGDTAGETYELEIAISNEPVKGRIILEKKGLLLAGCVDNQDFYGNSIQRPVFKEGYLAGAVFELRAAEDIVGADGTSWYVQDELIQTLTTTHDGHVSSMELPLGRYKLIEIGAPDGYIFDDTAHEVELVYTDNVTPVVEAKLSVSNIYMPVELSVQKVKEVLQSEDSGNIVTRTITTAPGEGFVFGLYLAQDIQYDGGTLFADTLCATAVTDKNGRMTISGRFPHAKYYVKELYAIPGWKLNPNRIDVTLTPEHQVGNTVAVELDEAVYDEIIIRHITLTKTDITGENTLPGAMIEVRDDDGNVIYRDYTDEDGEIKDIPITPGRYTFREVWAPDGYALNEARMSFTVDEDGTITGDTTIRDDYTRFSLLKQDEGGKPLAGVEFGLLKEDGSLLLTAVTDENGLATFEKVPYGSYTVVETQPLPGYLADGTQIQIGVDGTFINPKKPIATIINEKMRLHGRKVDTSGNALAGAEFALIDAATDEVTQTATSDEQGMFAFEGIGYGNWIVRETAAPDGFMLMEDVLLHIDESWTEPEQTYTFVNVPNHYEFEKVDNRKKPLAGVKFALEDADGNFICELVSGEDGVVHATGLKLGTYTIREVETVEGFTVTDEVIQFTVDGSYIPPKKLKKLKNYPTIQTGVDLPVTPLMCAGGGMLVGAVALTAAYIMENRKKGRRRKQKARR